MKKVFALILAAGMFGFASCDNTATTTEDTTTTEVPGQEANQGHDAIVIDNDSAAVGTDDHGHAH
jgi:uncharacterized lipoprotein YajG